jgi:AcrR family transcriptional regulator
MSQFGNEGTRLRILIAAEELFANFGYDGTSLRQLTQKAGVNLAAVNYHFGEKKLLYDAVVSRHMQPINQARLKKLENAEALAGKEPVALDLILEILIRPIFELGQNSASGGHHVARLVGRSMAEPQPFMEELLAKEFHPVTARFSQAMRRHVPHLSPEDFLWRLSFVVGAMHHTLATLHRMKDLTRGICKNHDYEGALRRLVQIAVVILTAPASSTQ